MCGLDDVGIEVRLPVALESFLHSRRDWNCSGYVLRERLALLMNKGTSMIDGDCGTLVAIWEYRSVRSEQLRVVKECKLGCRSL